jgi:hypothetical protein
MICVSGACFGLLWYEKMITRLSYVYGNFHVKFIKSDVKNEFTSPIHTRTEGRAPVWGSDFTTKNATIQGDLAEVCAISWWWCVAIGILRADTAFRKAPSPQAVRHTFPPGRAAGDPRRGYVPLALAA